MNGLDIIILVILAISLVSGLMQGFLYKLGSLLGLILGVAIAGSIYGTFGRIFGGSTMAMVMSFLIIYILVSKIIGIIFKLANRFFKIIDKIPLIKQFNRLLGAVLSFVTTVLVLSFAFYFISKFELSASWIELLDGSILVNMLIAIGSGLSFLLPAAVSKMKSYF